VSRFYTPHVAHSSFIHLLQAQKDLYYKSGQLVKFLWQWQGSTASLPGRMEELVIKMYERGYLGVKVRMMYKQVVAYQLGITEGGLGRAPFLGGAPRLFLGSSLARETAVAGQQRFTAW
jgi:hypothetical protein